jgi:CheY-like chemotaxis protein
MPAPASLPSAAHAFRPDPAAATFIRASLSGSPERTTGGGGLRVLLVDDNPVNQLFGKAMIEKLGFRAAIASDGADAVQRWKTESFDLILMDCQMPVMDGFAAARRIREGEAQRGVGIHTPIVALTGCIDEHELEDCFSAGMDAVLHKPLDPDELLAFVDDWVRQAVVSDVSSSRRACNPSITMPSSRAAASSSASISAFAARSLQACSSDAAVV